jgi:hypothetical protein
MQGRRTCQPLASTAASNVGLRYATPVNMLAVKSLLPDKGFMRARQLPLPAQRPLPLPLLVPLK